jgi:hypothetical protein
LTIDERLEALTQTVELLGHMQVEGERQRALDLAKTEDALRRVAEAQAKTEKTVERVGVMVRRMGRYAMLVARDHETRLAALEEKDASEE